MNARGAITAWRAYLHSSSGSGYVFLKDPSDAALKARVHGLLKTLAANPENGIEKIWTEQDLVRLGAQPGASFGVDMRAGYYTAIGHNALLTESTNRGGHGFDPTRPELHASFIATGTAFNKRGNLGVIRMTQIAPTLARLIGATLSPLADEPLRLDAAKPAAR